MAKSTVQEIPSATPPQQPKKASKQSNTWPQGVPIVGDLEAETFPEWLATTTDQDWDKRLICYLWRCEPITDRKAGGGPSSIDILTRKFDLKEIMKLHGSGRYRFDISYRPSDGSKQKRVRQDYETVFNLEHPPKIAIGEWIDDPRNKEWLWAKPALEAENNRRVLQAAQGLNPAAPPASKTEELGDLLELAQKLSPKDTGNNALLIELMKQNDPVKMLTLFKEFAALNKQDSGSSSNDALMMLLVKTLLEKQTAAPTDPLESTARLMTGFKGLFESMGLTPNPGTVAGKADTTSAVVGAVSDVLGKAIEQFAPIVPGILDVVRHVKDRDLQIAQVAAARGMNPAAPYQYVGTPQNPPAPHQPPAVVAPVPIAQPENGPMSPQVFFAKHGGLLQELFPFIADHFNNLDGYDLADFIIERKGLDTYNTLRKDASVDMLMTLVNYQPQLGQLFQPVEDAKVFFEELLCDPNNRPPEDEATEAPESGAAA